MEDKIPAIIKKEFNAKVIEIKRITEGYSHFMYLVKIDKEPKELILRFSNNKQKENSLRKEKFIIETLRKNKIPASKIYVFRKEYMILEKITGDRLDTIWPTLEKKDKLLLTEKIGKMLKDIHKIEFDKFGEICEEGKIEGDEPFKFRDIGTKIQFEDWTRALLRDSFKDLARLSSYEHISKKFLTKFTEYIFKKIKIIKYNGKPRLNHGDYMTGHIFVKKIENEYKIIGLIDFEFAKAFAPEYDFIKLHRQGFFEDKELKYALKKGYGKINEKAVEVYRMLRDLGFAWAVLEAGNKKLSDDTIKKLSKKLNF